MTRIISQNGMLRVIAVAEQGPPGIAGPAGPASGAGFEATAGSDLGGHRLVMLDSNNKLQYASADNVAHMRRIVGVTLNAAVLDDKMSLQNFGEVVEPSWNWDVSKPVYLGLNGILTQVVPTFPNVKFSLVVGFPNSPKSLFVTLREPIILS